VPESRNRRNTARRRGASSAGEGIVAGLADRVFENPAMSGGLVVMALTAAAIVSNAMFLQSERHPDPIFSTRPEARAPVQKQRPVPIPRKRADHVGSIAPADRTALADDPAAAGHVVVDPAFVAGLQKVLAGRGFYRGPVDGKFGGQTRAAIAAFEERTGLPVTGEPTVELLSRLRSTHPSAPVAVIEPPAAIPSSEIASRSPDVIAEDPVAAEQAKRYRRVQTALNDIGYGPVKVDGKPGEETANAIRRFALDNGLPVDGAPSDRLIARLVKIGAMQAD
jgi:peptidoglycan hydrolase-like protein with peptidoglycan-binding domain